MRWEDTDNVGVTIAECCGLVYRLRAHTVRVEIEVKKNTPILPPARESLFPSPDAELPGNAPKA